MARLDGQNIPNQFKEVIKSYPLDPDVDRRICACH